VRVNTTIPDREILRCSKHNNNINSDIIYYSTYREPGVSACVSDTVMSVIQNSDKIKFEKNIYYLTSYPTLYRRNV